MARRAAQPAAEPLPSEPEDTTHSGRLLLRMPQTLHAELARAAEEEGVSLNAYITSALAGAVRWRADAGGAAAPAERRRRLLAAALTADAVLVAVACVLAIALLIVAWP